MTTGIESQALTVDPSVHPAVLVVMFVAFLVGAIGPFALCVIGSIRDERAMRSYAAEARAAEQAALAAAAVHNPVDPDILPAAVALNPAVLDMDGLDPANDHVDGDAVRALRS
jgi:hypothetical protein